MQSRPLLHIVLSLLPSRKTLKFNYREISFAFARKHILQLNVFRSFDNHSITYSGQCPPKYRKPSVIVYLRQELQIHTLCEYIV